MSQKLVALFNIAKHALSIWIMSRFFISGMKNPHLI